MDLVGKVFGKYQITGRLGAGGMGVVYRAYHPGLEVDVALKALAQESSGDPVALARFRRESTVLARLRHPGIVAIQDSDTWEGVPFYVMPLISDPTLESELESCESRGEIYPQPRAVSVISSLLDVLEIVHQADVIHRDIKPANVFVDPAGRVMLTDFGLARSRQDVQLTRTGAAVGTLLWMAPEQLEGGELGPRTDLYQVGLLLYHLLDGRLPFAEDITDMVKVKCIEPSLPRMTRASVPAALVNVLGMLTARKPEERYADAKTARAALVRAGALSAEKRSRAAPGAGAGQRTARPPGRAFRPAATVPLPAAGSRSPGRVIAGVVFALLVIIVGLKEVGRRGPVEPAPARSFAAVDTGHVTARSTPNAAAPPSVAALGSAAPAFTAAPDPVANASPATTPTRCAAASDPPPAWNGRPITADARPAGHGLNQIPKSWPGARRPAAGGLLEQLFSLSRRKPDAARQALDLLRQLRALIPADARARLPGNDIRVTKGNQILHLIARDPTSATDAWDTIDALRNLDTMADDAQHTMVSVRTAPRPGFRTDLGLKMECLLVYLSLLYPDFLHLVGAPARAEMQKAMPSDAAQEAPRGFGRWFRGALAANRQAVQEVNRIDASIGTFITAH